MVTAKSQNSMIRINVHSHEILRQLAKDMNLSMQAVLAQALESYRRQQFLDQVNQAYAKLHQDAKTWKEHQTEVEEWDQTLLDGLESEPEFGEDSLNSNSRK